MNTATWTDSAPRQERALGQWAWPAAVTLTMLLAIVSGGSSQADSAIFLLFRVMCVGLLAVALVRLLGTRLAMTESLSLAFIIAGVGLVSLQLLPLPFGVFASLPGRDFVTKVFEVAGIPPQSMPMTLSPEATRASLLTLLPPIAFFLATLTTEPRHRWLLVAAILVGCVGNVFLGLAQRFQGPTSGLYFYEISNKGSATGFFSNRNNFAMFLCVSIPLTWAMGQKLIRTRFMNAGAAVAAGALMMLIILMGLAASNSRSGILLGMLSLTLSTLTVISSPVEHGRSSRRGRRAKVSLLAILGAAFIIGQFGMTGVLRVIDSDPLTDFRSQMRHVTLQAAGAYFPIGSGFGTFQAVYGMHETPATMISNYVNHAHNEWLELWLEGGLPAAALMACFVALFVFQTVRVWNPRGPYAEHVLPRAASVSVLVLLLHSLVEFPLRMPALACIFAAMLAILMAPPAKRHAQHHHRQRRPSQGIQQELQDDPERQPPAPVTSAPPVFKVPRADDGPRPRDVAPGLNERPPRR